ncbi:type II secretion system minor pseudopilin GspI [Colwellia sp. 4_MG-2023]|uniref:type II secretion system minor pseudopilin GspI n=1 Tax=unclassified Colwellia TaxID=196834 RepID=UPI0026E20FB4|nr:MULTISPECIES: type II secretion system minor pseudopilin GspI [unclassified Colwellia]MDO6489712.1 type II secretion system minor pseudopilin GspI [Colwellia sp. 6_MG-2023]MDO6508830.1 type II secretion system minor pseudopilin GspI [Colwellia sp. 5_MG-2023]MDO6557510.1 type II secretion system minor pseudopilin GspI [Colwellia sp. 4_MG-2023]
MIKSLNIKNTKANILQQQNVNKSKTRSLGFTLIEVMLALAVFSIAGIALLSTASNNARNMGYLETKMFADWVASNQLVAVNLDKTWPPKNNVKGEVKLAGRTWYWHKKVIKTTDNDMRSVVIEIRKDPDDELAVSSLTTFVSKVES